MYAKYYWDFSLNDIKQKSKNRLILDYFSANQAEAKKIICSIREKPITYSVRNLNEIDEKLRLLFFYLFDDNGSIQQENEIIEIIEKEYQQTFFETLSETSNDKENLSFIYMLDKKNENTPIWEINFIEMLSHGLTNNVTVEISKWKFIAVYYQHLQSIARSILIGLSTQNFNSHFPKLLLIDTKCRIISNTVNYMKVFKMTEIEFILTIESQAEQYLRESFVDEDTKTSCYSFRRQAFISS
jgi:hypothetical protein